VRKRGVSRLTEKWIDAELTEDDQVVSALIGNAAAFAAFGGAPLMLTEAVENGNDAIEDARRNFGFQGQGYILIEVNSEDEEIRVIDNGTGILNPIHVLKKPFKSLRRNVDYAKGQFGRGLQGFRGFCDDLYYVSRRSSVPNEESDLDRGSSTGRTVRLHFVHNLRRGGIEVVDDEIFEDFTDFPTGTAAIYRNWKPGEFKSLSFTSVYNRLEHHFGELIRRGDVQIRLILDEEELRVEPRVLKEDHRISIQPIGVQDAAGGTLGSIEFFLYYSSQADKHEYKKPFLMVDDRPLGDSFIAVFPEFADQPVWSSHYLTGYIKCDFVKPNDLRIALQPGPEKEAFVNALRSAAMDIEQKVKTFQKQLFDVQLRDEMNDLVVEVQRFLKDERIFDFKPVQPSGVLAEAVEEGYADTQPVGQEYPVVDPATGKVETVQSNEGGQPILGGGGGAGGLGPDVGPLPGAGGDGVGDTPSVEPIDPRLRGHVPRRKRQRRPSGFGLDFEPNELSDQMSWYEELRQTVVINSEYERFKFLRERSVEGGIDSVYGRKLRIYIIQRYLWEIVFWVGGKQNQDRQVLEGQFWNLNYKFFETRGIY